VQAESLASATVDGGGRRPHEPAESPYLLFQQGYTAQAGPAVFGPFGRIWGRSWGSSAGAENRAWRAWMLNEKNAFLSTRNPRFRHRVISIPGKDPSAVICVQQAAERELKLGKRLGESFGIGGGAEADAELAERFVGCESADQDEDGRGGHLLLSLSLLLANCQDNVVVFDA